MRPTLRPIVLLGLLLALSAQPEELTASTEAAYVAAGTSTGPQDAGQSGTAPVSSTAQAGIVTTAWFGTGQSGDFTAESSGSDFASPTTDGQALSAAAADNAMTGLLDDVVLSANPINLAPAEFVTAVPEAPTWAMFAAGAAMVLNLRRRRQR